MNNTFSVGCSPENVKPDDMGCNSVRRLSVGTGFALASV